MDEPLRTLPHPAIPRKRDGGTQRDPRKPRRLAATGEDGTTVTFETTESDTYPASSQATLALLDLRQGLRAYHLWYTLGKRDIKQKYRRSVLGPFWLTLSTGVLVGTLGTLYGLLFKVESAIYVPHLALGFIVWTLIADVITDGCQVFVKAENIIMQVGLPLSIHVYRLLWRNLLILCHNAAIFVVVAAVFGVWPGWTGLVALPGLALLCLNGLWAAILLGMISARFRDVPPIVASVTRICFFVTPVIWMPEALPERAIVLEFNPFYHMVEVVRAPLLGELPGLSSWIAVLGLTIGGWLMTFALFRRYRRQIAYWV